MEAEISLPRVQEPAFCPYPEPHRSSPCLKCDFLEIHFNIVLPSNSESSNWSISPTFPTKTLYATIHDLLPLNYTKDPSHKLYFYFPPDVTCHFENTDLCICQTTSDFCQLRFVTLEWIQ